MKPMLWMGLLAAGALSLYVSQQPDGEVAVVSRAQGGANSVRPSGAARSATTPRRAADQAGGREADPAMWGSLLSALERWRQRGEQPLLDASTSTSLAWAAQRPPPPPPAEVPPPAPPPPPMAPAFPHAWVGRYVDNKVRAVVAGPTQTWVVQARDVLDGQWRVDAIEERQMRLTYLPLQQSQTVTLK